MRKKILWIMLLWSLNLPAQYYMFETGGALGFTHQELANGFSTGFSVPLFLKYCGKQNTSSYLGFQYSWNTFQSSSMLEWTDNLDSSLRQKRVDVSDIIHTCVVNAGFEFNIPVNWQEKERRVLKYLYPYIGLDLDFFFITLVRYYVSDIEGIPAYLSETYHTSSSLLTPTIGAGIRFGTKILLKKRTFLNVYTRYQIDIPEQKTKDSYPNHFIQIGIGYEFMLGYETEAKSTAPGTE